MEYIYSLETNEKSRDIIGSNILLDYQFENFLMQGLMILCQGDSKRNELASQITRLILHRYDG